MGRAVAARGAPPELRPTATRLYARMRAWWADAFVEGAESGEFKKVDSDRLANRVTALLDGYGVRALIGDIPIEEARNEVWAALAEELGVDPVPPRRAR